MARTLIRTTRGETIEATVDRPLRRNSTAVVLAPGQGYHRALPLLQQSAQLLAKAAFTVVRFDWRSFTTGQPPSEDRSEERHDLETAITYAWSLPGIRRLILAGKSLGSSLALDHATSDRHLAGLVLLTLPVRDSVDLVADKLSLVRAPILIINAAMDPLCDLRALYRVALSPRRTPQVVVVPGNHALAGAPESVEVAARAFATWAQGRA